MEEDEIKAFSTLTRLRNILGELVIEYNADKITIFEIIDEHLDNIITKVGKSQQSKQEDDVEKCSGHAIDKIKQFFIEHPMHNFKDEQIAEHLNIDIKTIKMLLNTLENQGVIGHPDRWELKNWDLINTDQIEKEIQQPMDDGNDYLYCPHDIKINNFVRVPKGDDDFPDGEDIGVAFCERCEATVYPLTSGDFCLSSLAERKIKQYGYFGTNGGN